MRRLVVTIEENEYETIVDGERLVSVNGSGVSLGVVQTGEKEFSVLNDGKSLRVVASGGPEEFSFLVNGKPCTVRVESARTRLLKKFGGAEGSTGTLRELRAPMPALVVAVEVEVGQEVAVGQGLMILEAMKMENEIKSHHKGVVNEILVQKGDAVEKGELLIRFA
jgi:pyruvate carboxylase subunit B